MSDPVTLRPARKSDASDIALLVNIATHGGYVRGFTTRNNTDQAYDLVELARLELLKDGEAFGWSNATMTETPDGEVTGMLLGYREPDWADLVPPNTAPFMVPLLELEAAAEGMWFISMLATHIPWRNKGIGSRLLDLAEEKRGETGATGVALIVEDVNDGARRLYERRGYSVKTSRPMVRFPGGVVQGKDWLLMVKD